MNRIPSLDGFRAVSIILVLLAHSRLSKGFPSRYIELVKHGDVGVTIFFVISGFLITYLLFNEDRINGRVNLKYFFVRRAFRILPVFILYTTFIFCWNYFEDLQLKNVDFIHAITFTTNFSKNRNWFLGHFWSLSVEEQFYLFWPILIFVFKKHIKLALLFLISYSCFVRIIGYKYPSFTNLSLAPFFSYSDSILIGAWGGILFFENKIQLYAKILRNPFYQLISVLLIVLFVYLSGHGKLAPVSLPFGNTIISVSILFLLFAYTSLSKGLIFQILNCKTFVHIGVLSYSIYIWQQFFFIGTLDVFWRAFPYNLVAIYLVSLVSYYLLEKPVLKLRKKIING